MRSSDKILSAFPSLSAKLNKAQIAEFLAQRYDLRFADGTLGVKLGLMTSQGKLARHSQGVYRLGELGAYRLPPPKRVAVPNPFAD